MRAAREAPLHLCQAGIGVADLERAPADGARFGALPSLAGKGKNYAKWSKEYVTWLGANATQRSNAGEVDHADAVERQGAGRRL